MATPNVSAQIKVPTQAVKQSDVIEPSGRPQQALRLLLCTGEGRSWQLATAQTRSRPVHCIPTRSQPCCAAVNGWDNVRKSASPGSECAVHQRRDLGLGRGTDLLADDFAFLDHEERGH